MDAKSHRAVEPFVGLRFLVQSGCLCASEMESETPRAASIDPRARRAVAIILIVMGAFIVFPFVLYMLAGRGALPGP
jgi:hypothetical protein